MEISETEKPEKIMEEKNLGMNEEKQEACRKAWEYFQQNGITFNDILDCLLFGMLLSTDGMKKLYYRFT